MTIIDSILLTALCLFSNILSILPERQILEGVPA